MPAAATSGTPLIKQVRDGKVIATYTTLGTGGPFQRTHAFNKMQPGDVFEVYPAVYSGLGQYPWIGPLPDNDADYAAGKNQTPTNITIRGITVNGVRPVIQLRAAADYNNFGHGLIEIQGVDGLLWENIDVDGTGGSGVDRAGIYVFDSRNVTIRNARIHGFQAIQHNGVFGAADNTGTLWLDDVRLYDNGGADGPAHNVYINASAKDPNFTAKLTNSYATRVNLGHLFKSRAAVTVLENNLLEGTNTPAGWDCAESYDLDVPDGGRLTVTNNVFIKAKSGSCGNGIELRYGAESMSSTRTNTVTIEHNTFIARSTVWDDAGHLNLPMGFLTPLVVPTAGTSSLSAVSVRANRFEGFATAGQGAAAEYRGQDAVDVPAR